MKRHLHLAGKSVYYIVGAKLLLVAVVMMALARFMPWLEGNPEQVRAWLSQRAGRPVQFDRVEAVWTRSGPLLKLKNMSVGAPGSALRVGDTELLVSQYSGWWPGRRLTELRLRGLEITLEREASGTWRVHGLPGQTTGGDPFTALERLGELQVIGGKLRVLAPDLGLDLRAPKVDVRTQVNGDVVRVGLRGWLAQAPRPIEAVMHFNRRRGDGTVFVGGDALDLSGQAQALKFAGAAVTGGEGRLQTWLFVKQRQVKDIRSLVDLRQVVLQSTNSNPLKQLRLDRVSANTFFKRGAQGWSLAVPDLLIESPLGRQTLKGLRIDSGASMSARADNINLRLVTSLADLTDRLPAKLRTWLSRAAPVGELANVSFQRDAQGRMRYAADAQDLGMAPVDAIPGLRGLRGHVLGDQAGARFDFDPASKFVFDWRAGFGVPHSFQPKGSLVAWREGAGMRIGTHALELRSPDASLAARGGMTFPNDGTRPLMHLAAELIAPAQVTAARGFWVHNQMSKEAVAWLNGALLGGTVEQAQVVVSGDLDDWPFENRTGLFEVLAQVRDFRLKFRPDWPEVQGGHGLVQFKGKGMHIETSGRISGLQVDKATADIANLGKAELMIQGEGRGDARDFLALIRNSPLQQEFGTHTDPIDATGPARARVALHLPLHDHLPYSLKGDVTLEGVRATHKTYALAFDNMRGQAVFDRHGFSAENLGVLHEGQPGQLALRVGGGVRNPANLFEAGLKVNATAASLMDRVPDLAWMKPYLQGRSEWTVGIDIPRGASGSAVQALELRSNLVGTTLALPAPFAKPAATALPTTVRIPLPMDGRGDIQVSLGRLANVRARQGNGGTGVALVLGGAPAPAPSARGLSVTGTVPTLDALAWMAVMGGDTANTSTGGLSIERFDVQAERLVLGETHLPGGRLRMTPLRDGKQIQISGTALDGTLQVGNARNAPVTGRFERLRLALPDMGAKRPATTAGATAARGTPVLGDPRKLPPLDLAIKSLKLGRADFTDVQLKTSLNPGGVSIDRFFARAPQSQISATGTWLGTAQQSRTALKVRADTQNLGRLVDALGAPGQVSKGKGAVVADLAWPAGPLDLDTSRLSGTLRVAMTEGSLVKLEPGVGRVIGLFSVARLPRRLTLDFSDFFAKGFAFDSISGDIRFAGGQARTDGFAIKGPSADITIRGSAHLESRTFDQTIEVVPKAGNMLTVAGAVAGGPVGAAIGAVAGQILKKPLGEMAAKTYRVTGPWNDPKVETQDRNGRKK